MKNKRLILILSITLFVLSIPYTAMQFTNEVNWDALDFSIAGALLFGAGILVALVLRKIVSIQSKVILIGIILLVLFLIWAELAVGIFGTRFSGS